MKHIKKHFWSTRYFDPELESRMEILIRSHATKDTLIEAMHWLHRKIAEENWKEIAEKIKQEEKENAPE